MSDYSKIGRLIGPIKTILILSGIGIALANIAIAQFWLPEMFGYSIAAEIGPDVIIFSSIFIFFSVIVFIFFNRLYAMLFKELIS